MQCNSGFIQVSDLKYLLWQVTNFLFLKTVISVPRNIADRLDQSDESSGPVVIDYSEKRALPITIPDCSTVNHAGERYVVSVYIKTAVLSFTGVGSWNISVCMLPFYSSLSAFEKVGCLWVVESPTCI